MIWSLLKSWVFFWYYRVLIVRILSSFNFWILIYFYDLVSIQVRNNRKVYYLVNWNFLLRFHWFLGQILLLGVGHACWCRNLKNRNHWNAFFDFSTVDLHIISCLEPLLLNKSFLSFIHLSPSHTFPELSVSIVILGFLIQFYQLWIVCVNLVSLFSDLRNAWIFFNY